MMREVFIAKFENVEEGISFERPIIVNVLDDYNAAWAEALRLALEYQESHNVILLRSLTFLSGAIQ